MIKVPITYEDFDGNTVTEEHYFHLKKTELIDMLAAEGDEDLVSKFERIEKSGNQALIMRTFKEFIGTAYGQRVDGSGSEFYKDPDLTKKFLDSLAFDQLLTNLMLDEVAAAQFINGIMPGDLEKLAAAAAEKTKNQAVTNVALPAKDEAPDMPALREVSGLKNPLLENGEPVPWLDRDPTSKELTTMSHDQLLEVMQRKNNGWKPRDLVAPMKPPL